MVTRHYAEEFAPFPGQCFRMVRSAVPGAHGSPHHCPLPVAYRGTFKDRTVERHEVEACLEHFGPLSDWMPADAPGA
jgi:hypothetical protein